MAKPIYTRAPYTRTTSPVSPLKGYLDKEHAHIQAAIPPQMIRTVTDDDTAGVTDQTILVDATSAAITETVPAASRAKAFVVTVKKIDASGHAVTVETADGSLIDGAASVSLSAQWDAVTIQSNGIAYYVIGEVS